MTVRSSKSAEDLNYLQFLIGRAETIRQKSNLKIAKSTILADARNQLFLEELKTLFEEFPFPKPTLYRSKFKNKTARILNLMLSDLHYGADLSVSETGHSYSVIEEARRTASIVEQTADFKREYRKETQLYVHILGDIIQGKIHDPETAAPLTEQYYRAVWNLTQAISFLATQFPQVTVFCTPGNHGRRKDRHPDRAINQKWDSIERMIYGALAFALVKFENVKVEAPLTPYYIYPAFDQKGFMTHGDTVLNSGSPGTSINVARIRKQVNELNLKQHCSLYGVGHVHVSSSTRLPNNVVFVTNGCLLPTDEFSQSVGILETACCQQLWESIPGHIYGDRRDLVVDEKTEKCATLDCIVKPFLGMICVDVKASVATHSKRLKK